MSTTTARAPRSFTGGERRVGRFKLANVFAAIGITIAILLPFFFDSGSGFIGDSTTALAYVVMALGLNIVVGFAGLLDLGYVAFFAIGAYTMGWFGSSWFSTADVHIGVAEQLQSQPGIHLNWLLILPLAAAFAAILGAVLGFPTLRLRGDYIAIVTLAFGEIIGRVAVNSDEGVFGIGSFNLTNGRAGITPVDKIDLPFVERFTTLDLRPWYFTALASRAVRALHQLPAARLAHRAGVDRDPRGRGRGGLDGHPDRAGEAPRLRHGRGDGRHGRHVPRVLHQRGQRGPVRVLVLDLRARDDHPRRPRVDLGRGGGRARCCPTSTPGSSRTCSTRCRRRSGSTST